MPQAVVALPCVSKSTKSVFLPVAWRAAARFTEVVVFSNAAFLVCDCNDFWHLKLTYTPLLNVVLPVSEAHVFFLFLRPSTPMGSCLTQSEGFSLSLQAAFLAFLTYGLQLK